MATVTGEVRRAGDEVGDVFSSVAALNTAWIETDTIKAVSGWKEYVMYICSLTLSCRVVVKVVSVMVYVHVAEHHAY